MAQPSVIIAMIGLVRLLL